MENSTIAAIATPGGRGGIGIIKISGSRALSIVSAIFSPASSPPAIAPESPGLSGKASGEGYQSHHMYYGHIVDPGSRQVMDEVLLCVMKAPRTYTREDVVEINTHGGRTAVSAILELVLRQGARLAEPGEFTKRAFLNGRIDLTQAEAVIDVINARTDRALQAAAAQVQGTLSKPVARVRERLVALLTRVEAGIDFPDDVAEIFEPALESGALEVDVLGPLQDLIRLHDEGNVLREGLRVAVVGRPNVGKSSLLNRLVQKDRAIVTAMPGTTRDTIEDALNINGYPIILTDMAGLHETSDPIEAIGIQKAIDSANAADLILFMIEANRTLTADDHRIFERFRSKPMIIVINKIDLLNDGDMPELAPNWNSYSCLPISALYDRGIEALKERIVSTAFGALPLDVETGVVPNLRQKLLLEEGLRAAQDVRNELLNGTPMELVAIQLQEAIEALGLVLGTSVKLDVLDQIFSRFCIGK